MRVGDLVWMDCIPGGICILLKIDNWNPTGASPASSHCAQYTVCHPTGGIMKMPDYYFITRETPELWTEPILMDEVLPVLTGEHGEKK
jgi:hypothetical protein